MAKKAKPTLVDALSKALQKPNGEGQSVVELTQLTGMPTSMIRDRLRALHRTGRLIVSRKLAQGIDLSQRWVPCYRVKE